ncbi:hypothetical protein B0H12DRAFT_1075147 [Mycena haematopus]|nr:hypothetical protein B0H12DRAFT_1075147 [Mycena haematopus]
MSAIPPELLDAIVCEIYDVASLKVCSLVASTLRYSSQRILLSALTVEAEKCAALCQLLTESPHITSYVTRLTIRTLRTAMTSPHIESFRQILAKLQNVRRCSLDGLWYHRCIYVSPSVLWHFLTTVPSLHLLSVKMMDGVNSVLTHVIVPAVLDSLFLNAGTKDVGQWIAHPSNVSCLTALRHLSLRPSDDSWAETLMETASHTLEHIQFECSSIALPLDLVFTLLFLSGLKNSQYNVETFPMSFELTHEVLYMFKSNKTMLRGHNPIKSRFVAPGYPPAVLPHLPVLRTLKFTFSGQTITPAISEIISQTANILSSLAIPQMSPALADIMIQQHLARDGAFDPTPYFPLISLLDTALAAYPRPPSVHWLLAMNDKENVFAHFADTVRRGMPKAHSTGRLVLEAYVLPAHNHKFIPGTTRQPHFSTSELRKQNTFPLLIPGPIRQEMLEGGDMQAPPRQPTVQRSEHGGYRRYDEYHYVIPFVGAGTINPRSE